MSSVPIPSRTLWIAVTVNSSVLLSLVVYVISISYTAGQRARQMDVNTDAIRFINERGSPGVAQHLQALDRQIDEINKRLDSQENEIQGIQSFLMGTYRHQ